jgi:hypothetical protein
MRRFIFILLSILAALAVIIAAYSYHNKSVNNFPESSTGSYISADSSGATLPPLLTKNVSYIGTIEDLGPGTFVQGTHKLVLSDGGFLLLQSNDINLNLDIYLGKNVEVRGTVQPTNETGAMLMRVEEVTLLDTTNESGSLASRSFAVCGGFAGIKCNAGFRCIDDPSDSCDPKQGGADCSGICVPEETGTLSSSVVPETPVSSSVQSSKPIESSKSSASIISSTAASSPASSPETNANEQQILSLAKQIYDQDSLWTQKYCTSHIAFCIPVHKNWYFKSFGATTSNLWHVEFGIATIDSLGQGAMVLNLVQGTSASAGAVDGQTKIQGNDIIGFKDWNDGNHFELIADARLKQPVLYMLSHITAYNPGE